MYARQEVRIPKGDRELLRNLYNWSHEHTETYSFLGFPDAIKKDMIALQDIAERLLHAGGYKLEMTREEYNEED